MGQIEAPTEFFVMMSGERLLLTGASGQLGSYFLRELVGSPFQVVAWSGSGNGENYGQQLVTVDLSGDAAAVEGAFRAANPDIVVHTAAVSTVAACHADPHRATRVNVDATKHLVECADSQRARFVLVSTDLVFDGAQGQYEESDTPSPTSRYGQTKLDAEHLVAQSANHVITRMSLLYGPALNGRPAFFDKQMSAIRGKDTCSLFVDEWRTPLSFPAAAQGLLDIARSDYTGTLHLGGPERISRYEMGLRIARAVGLDGDNLVPARQADLESPEPRPRDASLNSTRWRTLFPNTPWPNLETAISQKWRVRSEGAKGVSNDGLP